VVEETKKNESSKSKSKILATLLRDDTVATTLNWRGHNLHAKSFSSITNKQA